MSKNIITLCAKTICHFRTICLETMNLFKQFKYFKGCALCTFWAHKECITRCTNCPQCRNDF